MKNGCISFHFASFPHSSDGEWKNSEVSGQLPEEELSGGEDCVLGFEQIPCCFRFCCGKGLVPLGSIAKFFFKFLTFMKRREIIFFFPGVSSSSWSSLGVHCSKHGRGAIAILVRELSSCVLRLCRGRRLGAGKKTKKN